MPEETAQSKQKNTLTVIFFPLRPKCPHFSDCAVAPEARNRGSNRGMGAAEDKGRASPIRGAVADITTVRGAWFRLVD